MREYLQSTIDFYSDWKSAGNVDATEEAASYFHCWSQIANANAALVVVLRIPHIFHLCSIIQGAANALWAVDFERSCAIFAEGETYRLLYFRQSESGTLGVAGEDVCRWWTSSPNY